MLTVFIRVDVSEKIGSGHLMRCLALAEGFYSLSVRCVFLVNPQAELLLRSIDKVVEPADDKANKAAVISVDELSLGIVAELIKREPPILVVLDGYHFSPDYRLSIKSLGVPVMALDDNNDTGMLFADIILNSSPQAESLNYNLSAPGATLLSGTTYCLLRPEFEKLSSKDLNVGRDALLLTFGGSDPLGLSCLVVEALPLYFNASVRIILVTGGGFQALAKLQKLLSVSPLNIEHRHNVRNMAEVFCQTRLAISAAGSTIFELAVTRTPALLVTVADNQIATATHAEKAGWCRNVDLRQSVGEQEIDKLLQIAVELWSDKKKLETMTVNSTGYVMPGGAKRVAKAILGSLH